MPGSNELNIENFNISDPNFPRLYSILIGCKPTAEHTPDKSVYSITYSPTESMEMMWTNLETAESEMVMRVITGKDDISAFDRFVERWYAEGGQSSPRKCRPSTTLPRLPSNNRLSQRGQQRSSACGAAVAGPIFDKKQPASSFPFREEEFSCSVATVFPYKSIII